MITVKATREGLPGGKTSTGYRVEPIAPFVALPADAALRQWVRVFFRPTGRVVRALVLDVGPWNIHDYAYVFQPATVDHDGLPPDDALRGTRPLAESVPDQFGRMTNGAGIDLGEAVWAALGLTDNALVSWEFV